MAWSNTAGAKDVWRLANIYANSNDPVNYPDWIPATGTKVSLPPSIQGWLIYRDEQQARISTRIVGGE